MEDNAFNFETIRRRKGQYPKTYRGPKDIFDQIEMLGDIFKLDTSAALKFVHHLSGWPPGAEGLFAVAKESALARVHFPDIAAGPDRYCAAVRLVLRELASRCDFVNALGWGISIQELCHEPPPLYSIISDKLRQTRQSRQGLAFLEKEQPGDILVVPGQYGLRYRDCSTVDALAAMNRRGNEFAPGALAVACMNLCNLDQGRFDFEDDCLLELDPVCAGDEVSPEADGVFTETPCFTVFHGASGQKNKLCLGSVPWQGHVTIFGQVSFFLPAGPAAIF